MQKYYVVETKNGYAFYVPAKSKDSAVLFVKGQLKNNKYNPDDSVTKVTREKEGHGKG